MLAISFNKTPDLSSFEFTFVHYVHILTDKALHFVRYLINSFIIAALSTLAGLFIASTAAYGLTRFQLRGKSWILLITLMASMFPPISLVSYLFKLMASLGWINSYPALIFPYIAWSLPLTLWLLVSYFSKLPQELDQAAAIDGCSRFQTLQKIIWPLAMPGLLSAGLLSFLFALNEFIFALVLSTDHRARTLSVGIALFQGLYGQIPWGDLMAASVLMVLPILILTLLFQKQIVQGLTHGGIKE